jgi:4-amino-4-deoxy-L-arabinose transferase-like glycosyltransferase
LAYWLGVATAAGVGVFLRTQTFTDLWTGVHNSWGGAFYGNVARNFLRYGWSTAFAPVVNSGVVDPSQFEIYYHHPPMTMWLTSLSFLVFGVHEWSARLVPLFFSFMTMALVFVFARSAFGRGAALCALAVFAVLPIDAYYGAHVDPNSSVSIFFTALAVEGYRRWLSSRRTLDYAIMAGAIVLGCMTGWFTYLVVPGIVMHGWLIYAPADRKAMLARLWPLPALCVGVFSLFLLHRRIALSGGRTEIYDALGDRLVMRTLDFGLDRTVIMTQYLREIWWNYSAPIVLISAAWFTYFVHGLVRRRLETADWCIFILWTYGLLYAFAFPGHLISHDFFVRTYAPGVAIASGAIIWRTSGLLRVPLLRYGSIALVLALVGGIGVRETLSRYAGDDRTNGPLLQGFGELVAEVTTPADPVFTPVGDRVMQYYVDRPMTFVETPEELEAAAATVGGAHLVIVPERSADEFPELVTYLRDRYTERHARGLYMYQGRRASQ